MKTFRALEYIWREVGISTAIVMVQLCCLLCKMHRNDSILYGKFLIPGGSPKQLVNSVPLADLALQCKRFRVVS